MLPEPQIVKELCWTERQLPQGERTKHVHGIHPYLGKYVPQLVEFSLKRYFKPKLEGVVLDPFVGSGTTVVEANIFGIDSVGLDISEFNVLLSRVKTAKYNITLLESEIQSIIEQTKRTIYSKSHERLDSYIEEKLHNHSLLSETQSKYLKAWYQPEALLPLLVFRSLIPQYTYQDALKILLSRAARSTRLAPHYELDFPKKPQTTDYYCYKHRRICHPTSQSLPFIMRYTRDAMRRIVEMNRIRTEAKVVVEWEDARKFNYGKFTVSGVITSPPYIGLIDYHEQHRYAFELLDLTDRSQDEIGSRARGNSKLAVEDYEDSIAEVFKTIADDGMTDPGVMVVIVNDKFNLYEDIAQMAGLKITERLRRRVDRRTGRRANNFYEDIFILRG